MTSAMKCEMLASRRSARQAARRAGAQPLPRRGRLRSRHCYRHVCQSANRTGAKLFNLVSTVLGRGSAQGDEAGKSARSIGDECRDNQAWAEAAEAYGRHLEEHPKDFGIWVQRGNCLKEAGEYDGALESYDTAILINRTDPDVHLQKGHLLKLMGKKSRALDAYQTSLQLNPSHVDAYREVVALGGDTSNSEWVEMQSNNSRESGSVLYLDVTDLLFYLRHHMNVSGIQRVISNIVAEVVGDAKFFRSVEFVVVNWGDEKILSVDARHVMRVINLVRSPTTTRDLLDAAIEDCYAAGRSRNLKRGDKYLILGAFWVSPSYERILIGLREKGVSVGVYIYDLIPITNRNFVTEDLAIAFKRGAGELLCIADFILTISEYVAVEVRKFMQAQLGVEAPVRAVTLAQELDDLRNDESDVRMIIQDAAVEPFVLCVGTIETRKNHQYLINLWRELIAERGAEAPNLVLVGRWGWRIQDLKEQLTETNHLDGKVIVFDSINDPELSFLYKNCMFTMFPSFAEGWGLPVGESLAYGKPCIASNTTSIPEVGGDLVRYIDPYDLSSGRRELRRVLDEPGDLDAWTKRIEEEFRPATWRDVAEKLYGGCQELSDEKQKPSRRAYLNLAPGKSVALGSELRDLRSKADFSANAAPLLRIQGWHPIESWGCWSKVRMPTLRFHADAPQDAILVIAMRLRISMPSNSAAVSIRSADQAHDVVGLRTDPRWVFVKARADEDGVVDIGIRCSGDFPVPPDETRALYIGVDSLGYYVDGNIEQRLDLLQDIVLG